MSLTIVLTYEMFFESFDVETDSEDETEIDNEEEDNTIEKKCKSLVLKMNFSNANSVFSMRIAF